MSDVFHDTMARTIELLAPLAPRDTFGLLGTLLAAHAVEQGLDADLVANAIRSAMAELAAGSAEEPEPHGARRTGGAR